MGALNDGGVGKIDDFWPLSRHISETVQDKTKVVIDHHYPECVHALSIGTKINDLEWPWPGFKVKVGKIGDFRPLSRQYLNTVEATIMQCTTCSSPIALVFAG